MNKKIEIIFSVVEPDYGEDHKKRLVELFTDAQAYDGEHVVDHIKFPCLDEWQGGWDDPFRLYRKMPEVLRIEPEFGLLLREKDRVSIKALTPLTPLGHEIIEYLGTLCDLGLFVESRYWRKPDQLEIVFSLIGGDYLKFYFS